MIAASIATYTITGMSHIKLTGKLPYEYNTTWGPSFVCFDALHPSQQFFSHVRMISCLPGLNQY